MSKQKRFFGLHFDYHACKETKDIGKNFDPEILRKIITDVQPDFIQCDTKGHPGLTSYYTKVGTPAPGMVNDLLAKWREVTKEYGVPLYSHYSGVWDMKAAHDHPSWAAVDVEGKVTDRMSVFGEYEDKLMIPELKELIEDYHMDGAWVDGECWAANVDYSPAAISSYEKKYHKKPAKPGENGFKEYLQFNRQAFFKYVRKYIDAAHSFNPDFMITSNWMNTAWLPDNIEITDYISGDLSPTNSVDSARFDGRLMAMYGRMWDIMSWGIGFPVHHTKGVIQLEQEAACILALGGGFQIYNIQDPTNVCLEPGAIGNWAEVSKFCHDRKQYCYEANIVPDMGILYSVKSYYEKLENTFFRSCQYNNELKGTMLGLLDQGISLKVVSEENLTYETLTQFPRFALSDSFALKDETINNLLLYVKNGGELLLMGAHTTEIFAPHLKLKTSFKEEKHPIAFISDGSTSLEVRAEFALIEEGDVGEIAHLYPADVRGDVECTNPPPTILRGKTRYPGLARMNYGQGKILIVPINVGQTYLNERTMELENFFSGINLSFDERLIEHNHHGELEVVYAEKDGHKHLHLINLLGPHRVPSIATFNHIPPLMDVNLSIQMGQAPQAIRKKPSNEEVSFAYDHESGRLIIHLDQIELYDILSLEF